jgi:hypothetical protein
MTRLELSIDEIVLVGIAPAERYRLADEIERELTRIVVDIHPSWTRGSPPVAIPTGAGVKDGRRGGSVARQVAGRISAVLATERSS